MSASLIVTGQEAPLPALGWAAAFLFLAVERDVRDFCIPNWLTLPALAGAIVLRAWTGGWEGVLSALAGAGVAFGILWVPFLLRGLGAGDVKAVMVLGALWGVELLLPVLWWMAVIGGVFGISILAIRGGLPDFLDRWGRTLRLTLVSRRWTYLEPAGGSAAARGIAFAVPMGLGAAAYQLWGLPWT